MQPTSKTAVTSAIDKARESCVMIETVKKKKTGKPGKSNAAPAVAQSISDIDLTDGKKSNEDTRKKSADSKKATKKVIIGNSFSQFYLNVM